jgi:signal peptidase I
MASYFAILLVCLSFGSGLIWLLDAKILAPKRQLKLAEAEQKLGDALDDATRTKILRQSSIAETAQSIFPVVVIITCLRSFLYEPFQIPSGSMIPSLEIGDFILVEKYAYGVKDPVTRTKFIDTGYPQRGDVAVFKFPEDITIDYIKRIVGLPGDTIMYRDKTLYIKPSCENSPKHCDKFNKMTKNLISADKVTFEGFTFEHYKEELLGMEHELLVDPIRNYGPDFQQEGTRKDEWIVPPGHYFAMGDNRDRSADSRYWGFVPDDNLVGKAVFIWMSFEFDWGHDSWIPGWIPSNIRFDRLGSFNSYERVES